MTREWTPEGLLAKRPRPTGLWVLPARLAVRLGFWSAWRQRSCPHPPHRARGISGDERLYGYRAQCMGVRGVRSMTAGIVERVQAAVVEADPTTMMPLSAALAAVRAVGDVLREAYDESHGWGLPLPGYDGCSDGCVACISDWLRKVGS